MAQSVKCVTYSFYSKLVWWIGRLRAVSVIAELQRKSFYGYGLN